MAWVALTRKERERVRERLPDIESLRRRAVQNLRPDIIAVWCWEDTDSMLPEAAVCLLDTTDVLMQIRHALSELLSFQIWYLERKDPPNKPVADYMAQFYTDDIALRLFAAVEHLNNAIIRAMEVEDTTLRSYGKRSKSLNTLAYLEDKHQETAMARIWKTLIESDKWQTTRRYRNDWVHNKPQIVRKPGDQFNRKPRWKKGEPETHQLTVHAGGDPPQWEIEQLVDTVMTAVAAVVQATDDMLEYFLEIIENLSKQSVFTNRVATMILYSF